ncbi:MAG: fatty-acid oxidation protein subunit alpha [Moorea sp. SIO4E2]|uniref:XisH family protein n=1 Tax=Moorena sp. SIO4E2 TaxID=2607826 RepID=UPI0013B8CFBF|nr:XisH family protein [Moorena sp. SIO4E2]NEQ10513.1 fatty-acid oxidation protein subunit alpha [Moorena sp. SIO4E2]
MRDLFHNAVRHGLEKDGWTITDDPLRIRSGRVDMQIDLGAERLLAATKGNEKIAVEIKSFTNPSNISEFHTALGQFLNYQVALEQEKSEFKLFLAIPVGAFKTFFSLPFVQTVVKRFQLSLLVYDPSEEVILEWKK